MPTFREINRFNPVQTVDPNWKVQVSATEVVTLQQIANLAPKAVNKHLTINVSGSSQSYNGDEAKSVTIKGSTVKLDDYSLSSNASAKSLSTTTTVTDAFEKLMQMLGGGYENGNSKLQVIAKKSTYLYHILRLMETVGNKNLDLISDPVNKVFGLLFDNTGTDPTSAITSSFSFQAKPWATISSGTTLYPNQVHTAGSTVAVTITKANWDKVNIGSAAVIVAKGTSKTISSIITTLVSAVKSNYTVYIPTSDQFDLLDTSTNAHMILIQKLGTYFFITVSPMVKA